MQMEELAQRIRRLARNLCPSKPLGEKRCIGKGVSAFAIAWNHSNSSKCGKFGFYLHQGAPGWNGCFEKKVLNPSEEHGADGTPNFIWSPHLIEMG